jgi:hypothetical protein
VRRPKDPLVALAAHAFLGHDPCDRANEWNVHGSDPNVTDTLKRPKDPGPRVLGMVRLAAVTRAVLRRRER